MGGNLLRIPVQEVPACRPPLSAPRFARPRTGTTPMATPRGEAFAKDGSRRGASWRCLARRLRGLGEPACQGGRLRDASSPRGRGSLFESGSATVADARMRIYRSARSTCHRTDLCGVLKIASMLAMCRAAPGGGLGCLKWLFRAHSVDDGREDGAGYTAADIANTSLILKVPPVTASNSLSASVEVRRVVGLAHDSFCVRTQTFWRMYVHWMWP